MANLSELLSMRQLRFFTTVAACGSFSRAAETLSLTQPALSAAIRQIETQLDVKLFARTTHSVVLTTVGAQMLPLAQRLLNTADHVFRDLREVVAGGNVSVRIGAVPSAMGPISKAVRAMREARFPADIYLSDCAAQSLLIGQLHAGAIDIAMGAFNKPIADVDVEFVLQDEIVLVVNRENPVGLPAEVPWSTLANQEIVHYSGGSIGQLTAAALHQNGLMSSQRYRVDQNDSMFGLVAQNLAVGVLPGLYAQSFERGDVVLRRLVDPVVKRNMALLRRTALAREHPLASQCYEQLLAFLLAG